MQKVIGRHVGLETRDAIAVSSLCYILYSSQSTLPQVIAINTHLKEAGKILIVNTGRLKFKEVR